MDRILKPDKLSIDPNSASATKQWRHWKRTFTGYVNKYTTSTEEAVKDQEKLSALISLATADVFEYIDECETYAVAERVLEQFYVKKPNDVYARHLLHTARQKPDQTLEDFRRTLIKLAKDCEFKSVTAAQYRDDLIRDAFINGIISSDIRQRLLEHKTLTLEDAFKQAVTLDDAKRDARGFTSSSGSSTALPAEMTKCSG